MRLVSLDGRHTYSVHRLVLENFSPCDNMKELQVNHKDGNKKNNSLTNLEWVSCQENITHAVENNLRAMANGAAKLTETQVIQIYYRAKIGREANVVLAQEFGVHLDTIGKIKNKKTWKQLLKTLND